MNIEEDKDINFMITEGNEYFRKDMDELAFIRYSQAIEKSKKKSFLAFLNRSRLFLKLERFYQAYCDALYAIKLDNTNEKGFYLIIFNEDNNVSTRINKFLFYKHII